MAIFNSYVKLPEGNSIKIGIIMDHPSLKTWHCIYQQQLVSQPP